MTGDRWTLPDGREAIELPGASGGLMRVAPIVPGWPWPGPPEIAARRFCTAMPSRYLGGAIPRQSDEEGARLPMYQQGAENAATGRLASRRGIHDTDERTA